jgi:hypothetical protein
MLGIAALSTLEPPPRARYERDAGYVDGRRRFSHGLSFPECAVGLPPARSIERFDEKDIGGS